MYRWQGLIGPAPNHHYEEVGVICPRGGSSALFHQRRTPRGFLSTEATGNSFGTLPREPKVILEKPEAQTLLFRLGNRRPQPTPNHQNSGRTEELWLCLVFSSSAGFPFGAYSTDRMKGKGFWRRTHRKLFGASSPIFRNSWSNEELCFQPSTTPAALQWGPRPKQ